MSSSVASPDDGRRGRGSGRTGAALAGLAVVTGLSVCGIGAVVAQTADAWQGLRGPLPALAPPSTEPAATPPAIVAADEGEPAAEIQEAAEAPAGADSLDDIITGALATASSVNGTPAGAAEPAVPPPARSRSGFSVLNDAAVATGTGRFDSLNRPRQPAGLPGSAKPAATVAVPPRGNRIRVPVSASVAGIAEGQPQRRPLVADPDPFGATGLYVGTFLAKAAVELSGGYSTNPGRFSSPRGSAFYLIAPELLIASNWSRHELIADLRGSFTGYGSTFALPGPTVLDRPEFTGRVTGRFDIARDSRFIGEWRSRIGTDNPGSPNVEAGLTGYPLYFANGASAGFEHDFNRLRLSASATIDRTTYQQSKLTDGTVSSNADRNVSRYGGIGRASFELRPGLRPFVEVQGDTRIHDSRTDRNGFLRDSSGGYIKVGSTFELTRLISGEAAIGYLTRSYEDPRLRKIDGLLTSGSLIWTPTGLTTVRLSASSSVDETTLPGSSGVISRGYGLEIGHDFRRWLTGTLRFAYGTMDYDGAGRFDRSYSVGGDVVYRLSRTVHVKASARHDWLESNVPGMSSEETVVMLGMRLQR